MNLKEVFTANKGKLIALVLTAVLGWLGYTVAFSETDKFLDKNPPASAPAETPSTP